MVDRRRVPQSIKMNRKRYPRAKVPSSVLGLDFGKYLLSKDKKIMESDVTTGTDSDTSDFDLGRSGGQGHWSGNRSSEYSDDSDNYRGYSDSGVHMGVYDTTIDSAEDSPYDYYQVPKGQKRAYEDENDIKIRQAIAQLNAPRSNNNFGRPLYAIHETASVSGSSVNDSDSQSGTPVHRPVYGRYQKLSNQNQHLNVSSNHDADDSDSDSLETLVLHRLPGENLGMILGIEGGKDDAGTVSHVLVKSVTLGGAAFRATGGNRGVCVSDEIVKVNGTDVRTLTHDECISVFKDMPLRVQIGVRRGQKDLPPVQISPDEAEKIDRKFDFQHSVKVNTNSRYDYSDSEEEKMTGFAVYKVTIEKQPYENLGLSIVPSYGSTKEFYQIKRILPSGAAAQSRQLQVGDRLITCNGHSLKRLTQNHCLNILKSASARGDVQLEVIRPVDNGNPMEISVTLNQNNSQIPGLDNSQRFDSDSVRYSYQDPSQYSRKSLSYDRQVDVVITSESEDYLTLSEDEYSKNRLGNISEAKAHELFSGKGPKLAYSKPFSAIEELSSDNSTLTETETEGPNQKPKKSEGEEKGVLDLSVQSSPYHIPKQSNSDTVSNLDNLITPSSNEYLNSEPDQQTFDRHSDLVIIDSNIPKAVERTPIGAPYRHPRQQLPSSEIDFVPDTAEIEQVESEDTENQFYSDINKGIGGIEYPENSLFLDNNGIIYSEEDYDISDSEKYFQPVSDSEEETESALPPPVEFSDSNYTGELDDNQITALPVSNVDDYTSNIDNYIGDSSEPILEDINVVSSDQEEEYPEAELAKLEASLRDLDEASSDQANSVPYLEPLEEDFELLHNSNLPGTYEVTINNQRVQFYGVQDIEDLDINEPGVDYEISVNNQIVPQHYDNIHATPNYQSAGFDRLDNYNNNSTMDNNSESMLKNALDIEYDKIPDSEKFQTRIILGNTAEPNMAELDDPSFMNQNMVADCLAQEMIKSENKSGYYMESDDEPDQMPDEDMYDEPPDLPDLPPPILNKPIENRPNDVQKDPNWSLRAKDSGDMVTEHEISPTKVERTSEIRVQISVPKGRKYEPVTESDVIVPVKVERKQNIPFVHKNEPVTENDVIVPKKVERNQNIPTKIFVNNERGEVLAPRDEVIIEPKATVTVSSVKPKAPPTVAPKPSPRKMNENKQMGKNVAVVQLEHVDEYTDKTPVDEPSVKPVKANKDKAQTVMNVVKVVSALKDHDAIDEPTVQPVKVSKDNAQAVVNAVKVVSAFKDQNGPRKRPESPKAVRFLEEVKKNEKERQSPPPKRDIIETNKVTIQKPKAESGVKDIVKKMQEISQESQSSHERNDKSPVRYKTQIQHTQTPEPKVTSCEVKLVSHEPKSNTPEPTEISHDNVVPKKPPAVAPKPKSPGVDRKAMPQQPPQVAPKPKSPVVERKAIPQQPPQVAPKPKSPVVERKVVPQQPPQVAQKPKGPGPNVTHEEISHKTKIDIKPEPVTVKEPSVSQVKETNVPPLNLEHLDSFETGSSSPKSDKSDSSHENKDSKQEIKFETVHKTTIGISKPGISNKDISNKDVTPISEKKDNTLGSQVKQLSQIKPLSFNPKSLSKPQAVQYKTTINTLGSKPGGISTLGRSSLLSTQKPEHPIKRMETLPFEVSILKGILGIGIKTKMTPEGYVQITEILPSGPVGREGNIKVGDYLLSINNTELTGLPDGKVQQILRLLPRGLSKIVASAVPPEQDDTKSKGAPEKSTSPRSSVPLAASRQPHMSTSQKSATLPLSRGHVNVTAPKQPIVSTKSLPFASKPFGSQSKDAETPTTEKQTKSPVTSPRSPKSPKIAPALAPRQRQKHSTSSESPQVSPRSPLNSPRKAESEKSSTDSEKSTPRTPPRVAPKPRRDKHPVDSVAKPNEPEMKQTVNDESGPIETEIFASITGPKSEHVPTELTGPSVMPGSVTLDFVPKVDTLGKVDVVEVTESQPVTDTKLEQESIAPVHESAVHMDVVGTVKTPDNVERKGDVIEIDLSVQTNVERGKESGRVELDTEIESKVCEENTCNSVQQTKECDSISDKMSKTPPPVSPKPKRKSITDESLSKPNEQIQESIVPCETVKSETAIILADNKTDNEPIETEPKTETKQDIHESDSPTNKDYHFRAPEHVDDYVDIIETRQERSASVSSESSYDDFKQCDVQDESYLEDIVEENDADSSAKYSELTQKEEIPVEQMEVYKSMAEHIVADVIETVKAMDLSESNTKSPEISVEIEHKDNDSSEIQINADDSPPPLPESDAPPLPLSPPPITDTVSSSQFAELNSEQVNSQTETSSRGAETDSKSQIDTEHENGSSTLSVDPSSLNPIEDIIEISHTSQVHASIPTVVVSVCPDADNKVDDDKNAIDNNTAVHSQEKIGLGTEELAEYSDDFDESSVASETEDNKDDGTQAEKSDSYFSAVSQLDENLDDQSINTVISMYEDIGKSIDSNQNIETIENKEIEIVSGNIKTLDSDENESIDTKSITSSDDVLSEGDIIENQENGVPRTETGNEQGISQGDSEKRKVNGFSRGDSGRPKDLRMDANSDKGDSPFSSDSAMSPARSGTPHSDDERVDVDRMIRLLSTDSEPHHTGDGEIIHVKMNKGVTGVGFVIQGGKGSPKGDQPITIKRIFKGGPADQCGQLQVHDEILDVNGEDLTGMRHSEAWQHLKFLPSGEVIMTIRRFSS